MKLKETNLEKIKEIATTLLYVDIKTTNITSIVSHPFADTSYLANSKHELINILEEDGYEQFIKLMKDRISNASNYYALSAFITKPYRSTFFKYTAEYATDSEAAQVLKNLWISTETVNIDKNITRAQYVRYFKKYRAYIMDESELEIYNSFADEILIYRGINEVTNHPKDGMCWTPDLETARFFANRFVGRSDKRGMVYQAKINKEDILAYISYEKEVVVDYRKLKELKIYEYVE